MRTDQSHPAKALALAFGLALSACSHSSSGGITCPAEEGRFAVQVKTLDATSAELLSGLPAGVVVDGMYSDSLKASGYRTGDGSALIPIAYSAAWNRPGTYSVTIKRDGYRKFVASGLTARNGPCGVLPVTLTAQLIPE